VLVRRIRRGTGMGVSFVSLTTAGLAGVAPADAGAASGLINVMQQLGAALGLAVLVTVFDSVAHPGRAGLSQVATPAARATLVHGMDVAFAAGAGFALAAVAIVAVAVRTPKQAELSSAALAVALETEEAAA
jgi:hypothetical protein